MTQNDNFKYYYGQSLINKDTISEYESILDYIVTHGGSGSGIDADMLDGYDSNDFLLIKDKDMYMPPGFYIGYTTIKNVSEAGSQFLYTRDMKLNGEYRYMFGDGSGTRLKIEKLYEDLLGEGHDSAITVAKTNYIGDWDIDHENKILNAGLCDLELAINCLLEYENKNKDDLTGQINELRQCIFDPEDFSKLQYILNNYLIECQTYDDEGNLTNNTELVLDAGAVNGLRFFLVTQHQYDQYPEQIRADPRYIFIIRDDIPEGYMTPTTISAGSFKPLFKTDGYNILVSVNGGKTYYEAGKLYQWEEDGDGLIPMYIGGETLPTILADPTKLGDNFFINGTWMRNFLSADPSTVGTLEDLIDAQLAGLKDKVDRIEENLNDKYELKENKITTTLVDSTVKYPSSHTVMEGLDELQAQIEELEEKIGQIDDLLTGILGTGTD